MATIVRIVGREGSVVVLRVDCVACDIGRVDAFMGRLEAVHGRHHVAVVVVITWHTD